MQHIIVGLLVLATLAFPRAAAQQRATPAEIREAEINVPALAEVLDLRPGMTVADVGAGLGDMAMVMARIVGPNGRVYATDVAALQLQVLRQAVTDQHLDNVVVVEGAERATALPEACCDAIYMRDVYHHFVFPADMDRSLFSALKRGGRLAIIDFDPEPGSRLPQGVAANRGGHGIRPPQVIDEVTTAGFKHLKTITEWPPDGKGRFFLLLFARP